MRFGLIGSSLLAVSMALSACSTESGGSGQTNAGAEQQQSGWTEATAKQLRDAIGKRAEHGLDRLPLDKGIDSLDQAALTKAALAYGEALAHGATDPTKLFEVYTLPRPDPDLKPGLAQALKDGKVGDWLESLAPRDDGYRKLSQTYLSLRGKQGQPGQATPVIADSGEPLKPGSTDPRIPAIAQQLVVFDYLDRAQAQGQSYSPAMVAAVKRMQADYGINPDGLIGSDAIEILNLSDADRARAIAVNLERLRWLEREPPATRIDVNIATARLRYWRDGKVVDERKVIVGEPDTETPQLGSPIFQLVANPTWTVPRSIQEKEIARKGAGYLRENNMVWKDGWIVQQPGPRNSLGLVKFDMKNEHAIYLHDTPAKQVFNEVQRQRSHGCVRVFDALGFAEMLARDNGVLDEWNKARATGKESFVKLPKEIPVRLLYQTAVLDADGTAIVRADPYGWNDKVAKALGFDLGTMRRARSGGVDIGP